MRVLAATPKVQQTKVERLKVEEIHTVLATLKDRSVRAGNHNVCAPRAFRQAI
jgi:hypothetical protein